MLDRLEAGPGEPALGIARLDEAPYWLSREELFRRAAARGASLARRGVAPGDVVLIVLPADLEAPLAVLGSLLAGAVPVLAAPPVVKGLHSNLGRVLEDVRRRSEARCLVSDDATAAALAAEGCRVLTWPGELEEDPEELRTACPDAGDTAALQLTSGTTGFPRICVWSQEAVLAALDGMYAAMGLGSDDVCVNWTPLYHDMGLVNNLLLCLTRGVPLMLIPTTDFMLEPGHWLRTLHQAGGTVSWSPNFGFALTAARAGEEDLRGVRLDRVRSLWNAAERVHLRTLRRFHRRFAPLGLRRGALKTNFGCAENVGGATFSDLAGPVRWERLDARALRTEGVALVVGEQTEADAVALVGVGRPHPGLQVVILGENGEELPEGRVGEIALRTPSRMRGYLGDPEATAEVIRGDLLLPGDLGYLRAGELFWVGRSRERINLHGKKLDPSELEGVLLDVGGLRPGCFAAFGVEDAELGSERLVIVAEVGRSPGRPLGEILREVRRGVATRLGVQVGDLLLMPYGSMSKTSSGKRRHRHYRRLYLGGRLQPLARQRAA